MSVTTVKSTFSLTNGQLQCLVLQWLGLLLSAGIYMALVLILEINLLTLANPLRAVVQALGFIVLPVAWWTIFMNPKSKRHAFLLLIGTPKGRSPRHLIRSVVEGLIIYVGFMLPLFYLGRMWNPLLFTWFDLNQNPRIMLYLVSAIVSVTSVELITKGYLMTVSIENGLPKGIVATCSMVAWCVGHVVEFMWLSAYVPAWYAIFLLLLGGILSIISVFNTENIVGVIVGHIMINVVIVVIMSL